MANKLTPAQKRRQAVIRDLDRTADRLERVLILLESHVQPRPDQQEKKA